MISNHLRAYYTATLTPQTRLVTNPNINVGDVSHVVHTILYRSRVNKRIYFMQRNYIYIKLNNSLNAEYTTSAVPK